MSHEHSDGQSAGSSGVPGVGGPVAPRLVLASGSPRRRDMLGGLGISVEVRRSDVDETVRPGEAPAALVERLAREKAAKVAAELRAEGAAPALVLAADTEVAVDGEVLGKPADDADAAAMLRRLAGRSHDVLSGVALVDTASGRTVATVEHTLVTFAPMSAREIVWYVASGEARDKAGAYGIQGKCALFVERVAGNYNNVVGLPLATVQRLVRELGYDLLDLAVPAVAESPVDRAVDSAEGGRYVEPTTAGKGER